MTSARQENEIAAEARRIVLRRDRRLATGSFGYSLTPPLNALNEFAGNGPVGKRAFDFVQWNYRRMAERYLCRSLTPASSLVLSGILTRTLGWQKYVEIVTLGQLANGIRDPSGALLIDANGIPVYAGTGLGRSTVVRALDLLLASGLVERFPVERNGVVRFAYLPMNRVLLMDMWEACGVPREKCVELLEPFDPMRPPRDPDDNLSRFVFAEVDDDEDG